ncbi:alanine/ornithine racemase family PLP-dependent enzyme [Staphylococcus edaphicus]|uniref:Alanine racemase n=1 Tax=Staphylococcus edaphicus TaxID=1955013 RepID=A0A2C6WH94_9STAP|nr:alanine/ornithine racemase family PLP-dependent enzyme [Staphylococcus edaphicus]PHK50168.1 alanine racemase [Staphylococcus edaphicus]UQW82234.1 alanine/ornithine racemase family PLP-dependent enzyme [Staphylococcus edaphicus]
MAQIKVNLSKIKYNAQVLSSLFNENHIRFTPVIKCVGGDKRIVQTLKDNGLTHFADARIENITKSKDADLSFMMIRTPSQNELIDVVQHTDISIQTEITTIRRLNKIAEEQEVKHKILLMVDWKDSREGILTYDIIDYINEILYMHHVSVVGLAFNFMCFQSIIPTEEDVSLINQYVESVERETNMKFSIISGGNSSMLTQMLYRDFGRINELRIGETLFRGIETTTNQPIAFLYQNAVILEAEIVEIKPRMDIASGHQYLQAIVDMGNLDTVVEDIKPLHHRIRIIGATSDHVMLDLLNQDHYQIGDKIQFSLGYKALAQSMYMVNLEKIYNKDEAIEKLCCNFNVEKSNRS